MKLEIMTDRPTDRHEDSYEIIWVLNYKSILCNLPAKLVHNLQRVSAHPIPIIILTNLCTLYLHTQITHFCVCIYEMFTYVKVRSQKHIMCIVQPSTTCVYTTKVSEPEIESIILWCVDQTPNYRFGGCMGSRGKGCERER